MRFRQIFTLLLLPLFVVTLWGCKSGEPPTANQSTPGLWEISYKENKSYLFGAIHVGSNDMYPLPSVVDEAFANAKTLIIEANPDGMSDLHAALFMEANAKTGHSLLSRLPKETAELLRAYCDENQLPVAKIDRLTAWAAWLVVESTEGKKTDLGLDSEKGIDKYFMKKAINNKKPVIELETVRGHMDLLARLDRQTQETLLLVALREAHDAKEKMMSILATWKSGNLEQMNRVFLVERFADEPRLKSFDAKFIDERNVQMTARIEKHIRGKDSAFIVVGAGHIPGDMGILKLLEQKRFTIKQVYPPQ
jgi:uncharacterized protein YbaP (TraB family)